MLHDLRPNQKFAHYQLQQKIGEGGMGSVYRAIDLRLQRAVAIKFISNQVTSQQDIERFLREARAMAKLDHENIVKIYEVGISPAPFIAMEFLEGQTLKELIQQKLPAQQFVEIIIQVSQALIVAHRQNIIHRDIKPANIIVGNGKAKLMDFGLAKNRESQEQSLSKSGAIIGTAAYMPPEQVKGETAPTNDIYSLGAVLYEGLTGMPPFQGDNYLNILSQLVLKDPVAPRDLNPDISIYLEAICLKCLHKKPQYRYQSAKSLKQDLVNFMNGQPIVAKPYTNIERWKKSLAQHKVLFSVIALFMLGLSTMFVVVLRRGYDLQQANAKLIEVNKVAEKRTRQRDQQIIQLENSYQYSVQEILTLFQKIGLQQPQLLSKKDELAIFMVKIARYAPKNLLPTDKEIANEFLMIYFQTRLGLPIDGTKLYANLAKKSSFMMLYIEKQALHCSKGEYQQALDDCKKMLQLNRSSTHPYYLIAFILFLEGKYHRALKRINILRKKNPKHIDIALLRGRILHALGRHKDAIRVFNTEINNATHIKPQLYYQRSSCYAALQKFDKGIADCEKALEIDRTFIDTYVRLADIYVKKGKYSVAIDNYQKYVKAPQKNKKMLFVCYNKIALCFHKKKEFKRAITYWEKVLQNPKIDKAMKTNILKQIAKTKRHITKRQK
ncbi:serine/threonine-protein kinase [Candidatus Uabimicrobium amorphum]|uniref:non-specific serine/threonine protein kinase n=1 Tax=Uabimicrobium amorphum TaxID=2596890 RepID=A0A5S9IT88_UABAM|nr:serine/threonine-protein kinase [Candidatus Uabimicrobium amorphum]BBM86992.1 serine/threonine protein kinase [Candidatus Uabimicrobium amorphum]